MSTLFPHDPGPHVPHEDVAIGATYYRRCNGLQALFTVRETHPQLSFIGALYKPNPTGADQEVRVHSAIAAELFPVEQVRRRMEVELSAEDSWMTPGDGTEERVG